MKIKQSLTLTAAQRRTITTARESADLTSTALATMLDISRPMLAQIESGKKPAPPALLAAIAKKLGLEYTAKIAVSLRPKKVRRKGD